MTLKESILNRRSIGEFSPKEVEKEKILELIEMAIQAPSASNAQPWKFLIVQNQATKSAMGQAVIEEEKKILDLLPPNHGFADYGSYFVRFVSAPIVLVPLYKPLRILTKYITKDQQDQIDWESLERMEHQSSLISLSLAMENLLLYAQELGLGASCMTGPLIARKALREILSLPKQWEIGAIVPLGYADEKPVPKGRKKVQNVVKWM